LKVISPTIENEKKELIFMSTNGEKNIDGEREYKIQCNATQLHRLFYCSLRTMTKGNS